MRNFLILLLSLLAFHASAQAIKTFPLDDHTVYHLKVSPDKITTVMFPQTITALENTGISSDPKVKANLLLSYQPGAKFFSIRAMQPPFTGTLNVIANRKIYVLEFGPDPEPFQSVRFYASDEPTAFPDSLGQKSIGPNRLLALLDQAKAFPILAEQYPEMVSQIDHVEPMSKTLYQNFDVILTKVFRFDPEDALIFQITFLNRSSAPIRYLPQSLGVRVGPNVYSSALSDASGVIPAGTQDPILHRITPGQSTAYFVICGTPQGGRTHLSVNNPFNILVFRPEHSL